MIERIKNFSSEIKRSLSLVDNQCDKIGLKIKAGKIIVPSSNR